MFQFFRSTHSGWNISILLFYSFRMERILLKCFNPSVLLIQDGKNFIKMFQSFRSTHSGWKEFYKNVSVLPFQSFHSTHSGWKEFYKNVSVLSFYSFRMERILQKCFSPSVLLIQDGKNFTKMFQSFHSTHSFLHKNVSLIWALLVPASSWYVLLLHVTTTILYMCMCVWFCPHGTSTLT